MKITILSLSIIVLIIGCSEKATMTSIKQKEIKNELRQIDSILANKLEQMEFYIHRYKILSKNCIDIEEDFRAEKKISEEEKQLWEAEIEDCYKDSREGTIDLVSMSNFNYQLENLKNEGGLDDKKYDYIKSKLEDIEDWIRENSKK